MPSNNPNAVAQLKPFTGRNDPRNGRKPKGAKHLSTWIQELLNDEEFEAQIQQGLKVVNFKGAPIKAIIQAQVRLAINGDSKAFEALGKYGYGTKLQLSNDPDNPISGKTLSDEEIIDRFNQIVARGQAGTERISSGDGPPPSS